MSTIIQFVPFIIASIFIIFGIIAFNMKMFSPNTRFKFGISFVIIAGISLGLIYSSSNMMTLVLFIIGLASLTMIFNSIDNDKHRITHEDNMMITAHIIMRLYHQNKCKLTNHQARVISQYVNNIDFASRLYQKLIAESVIKDTHISVRPNHIDDFVSSIQKQK